MDRTGLVALDSHVPISPTETKGKETSTHGHDAGSSSTVIGGQIMQWPTGKRVVAIILQSRVSRY